MLAQDAYRNGDDRAPSAERERAVAIVAGLDRHLAALPHDALGRTSETKIDAVTRAPRTEMIEERRVAPDRPRARRIDARPELVGDRAHARERRIGPFETLDERARAPRLFAQVRILLEAAQERFDAFVFRQRRHALEDIAGTEILVRGLESAGGAPRPRRIAGFHAGKAGLTQQGGGFRRRAVDELRSQLRRHAGRADGLPSHAPSDAIAALQHDHAHGSFGEP